MTQAVNDAINKAYMLTFFSAAIKRYFTSQKEATNRPRKNKTESHKKDRQLMKEGGEKLLLCMK